MPLHKVCSDVTPLMIGFRGSNLSLQLNTALHCTWEGRWLMNDMEL